MKSLLFVFGRTPKLSFLELQTFLSNITTLSNDVGLVEVEDSFDPKKILETLGGTVKIAEIIGITEKITPQDLAMRLNYREGAKQITFGVSSYTPLVSVNRNYLNDIKKQLILQGISSRFIEPKHQEQLSSVVVKKQAITELIITKHQEKFIIGKTIAVQDFEAWGKRDYGRPFADPRAGMLPPKVARMAVNIASLQLSAVSLQQKTLLDPFCGMGTILAEALLTGWKVIGSDQSNEVVEKAQKNLEWLEGSQPSKKVANLPPLKLFVSDATHVSEKLEKESIDAIVTEPFMGAAWEGGSASWRTDPASSAGRQSDQFKQFAKTKNIIKGLEKLYIGCLKDWHKVLKPGGKVVIALPEYSVSGKTYFVKKVVDNCENLGYTVLHGPIEYSRPGAVVRRQFFVLQKN